MRRLVSVLVGALVLVSLPTMAKEPDLVVVQHVLISFKNKSPGKKLDRTKQEAKALADELLARAKAGEDFDAMVKEYTNDKYPGIYKLTNRGATLLPGAVTRGGFVPAFGDVSFRLEVGEIGMTRYGTSSPYGWHIIKRLE